LLARLTNLKLEENFLVALVGVDDDAVEAPRDGEKEVFGILRN